MTATGIYHQSQVESLGQLVSKMWKSRALLGGLLMFTVDNFIKGLTATTHGLSASIQEDTILLFKDSYDFERDSTYQEQVAILQIGDIQTLAALLDSECFCADAVFMNRNYFEVAVQTMDHNRPMPAYMRSEQGAFELAEHNYHFVVSKASKIYLFALFCSFADHPGKYDVSPLRWPRQEVFQSVEELFDCYRIYTAKVTAPKNHSLSEYKKVCESYIFNVSYCFNTALSIADFSNERRIRRFGMRGSGQLFPYRAYKHDLTKYYHQAISSNLPFMQYLAFYHVAEFFFQSISEDDAFQIISDFITRPTFSPYKHEDIKRFYEMIKKKMREQRDDGVWNEKNGLLLCLKRYVPDIAVLKNSITRIDNTAVDYYQTTPVTFADDGKTVDFSDEEDKIYVCIRDRIYATRNAIVHSKSGGKLRYEPFKHDKHLAKEIPLIRAVAEEIIINSAEKINYSFIDA